jgi:thioredoxin 1
VIAPTIEELSLEYEGKVKFVKINVDEAKRTALSHDIMSIPTIILFNQGKPIARQIGAQAKPVLDEMIADTLRETD